MTNEIKFSILAQTFGTQKVDDLRQKLGGLGTQVSSINSKLVNGAAGTYIFSKAFEVGSQAAQSFFSIINDADKLNDLSEITGISAKSLDQFSNAAKMSGLEIDKAQTYIKKFTSNLGDINNEKTKSALTSLGITVLDTNGKIKSSDLVLKEVADKFSSFEDGSKKAALASALFGKSGSEFIPTLNLGSQGIEKLGTKMSDEFPRQAAIFNDALDLANKKIKEQSISFLEVFLPSVQTVLDSFNQINSAGGQQSFAKDLGETAKVISVLASTIFNLSASVIDIIITSAKDAFEYIAMLVKEIGNSMGAIGRAMISISKGDIKNALSGFKYIGDDYNKYASNRGERVGNLNKRLDDRMNSMLLFNSLVSNDFTDNSVKLNKPKTTVTPSVEDKTSIKESEALAKFAIAQANAINQERLKIENYALSTSELEKMTIAQDLHSQALKETLGWETSAKDAYIATTDAVIKQKQALIDMQQQQKMSFEVGAKVALKEYLEKIRDVASQTKELFTTAFSKMEDALVGFVKTGKLSFNDFANAVIDDMIRIAVRQATLGILVSVGMSSLSAGSSGASSGAGSYLGANTSFSANGNVIGPGGPLPLSFFANGGVVNSPHLAVFGEGTKPEAFVPLPDGRTIPVTMNGAGGGSVNITVIYNESNGKESVAGSENGKALSMAVAAAVKAEILNQKRAGGILS